MRDEVTAGGENSSGILQIENVRRDLQPLRVRLIDHRAVHLCRHLLAGAEIVVDTNFDQVGLHRLDAVDGAPSCLRIGRRNHGPCDKEARDTRCLLVTNLNARWTIPAEAEHGRDAVARVDAELMLDVLGGVELRAGLEPSHVVDVAVRVDHPRHDRPAGDVDACRGRGDFDARRRPDRGNLSVLHDHHRVVDWRRCRTVDDPGADKRNQR